MTTSAAAMPLDAVLKEKFRKLVRGGRKALRKLAVEVFEVHRQHYLVGDQNVFETWWNDQGLDNIFGSRTNWTKWFRAGEAIEKAKVLFGQHVHQLPLNRDALYEVAMLRPDELS